MLSPVGISVYKLEADFHIIHGMRTRIQNTIRCVKELPLEVEDVVFNPLASAQVVLNQQQKNMGALVIDMGGGTTDYILYVDGAVKQSGTSASAAITLLTISRWGCAFRWPVQRS